MNLVANQDEPWLEPWCTEGLESVEQCPVCGELERKILHTDLVDNVFRVSTGKWCLWKCTKCQSAYLDPRPTRETIHLAYASYYTHKPVNSKDDYAKLSPLRKLRRSLVNGYTNWRYGTNAVPSMRLGVLVAFFLPNLKRILDREYRHLPRIPNGGGTLLDVGCGDGSFLSLARTCGWDVTGLEPDPKAVKNARSHGLTVYEGGIEYFSGETEIFDVITLNHVIEHVGEPSAVLKACHTLLKPSGQLWLETPNIESSGHAFFQKNWRGLEVPRHLVLFNRSSLSQAIINAGFMAPQNCNRPSPSAGMFQASFAIANGQSPYEAMAISKKLLRQAKLASLVEIFIPSRREFLLVKTRKAKGKK
jgi:2-polyprenyl-3-methyl-5-hydroxy-6-metoxy-1,4-benzoquinol methylase